MIGDCQCLIDGQYFDNPKSEEAVYAAKRAQYARQLLAEGVTQEELLTHDTARDYILQDIVDSMKRQNVTFSVIDGFPIAEQHVPVFTLDFQPHELVFATDSPSTSSPMSLSLPPTAIPSCAPPLLRVSDDLTNNDRTTR